MTKRKIHERKKVRAPLRGVDVGAEGGRRLGASQPAGRELRHLSRVQRPQGKRHGAEAALGVAQLRRAALRGGDKGKDDKALGVRSRSAPTYVQCGHARTSSAI